MANVYCGNGWYFTEASGWSYVDATTGTPIITSFSNPNPAGTTGLTATLPASDEPNHPGLIAQRDAWATAALAALSEAGRTDETIGDCYGDVRIIVGKLLTSRLECKAFIMRVYVPVPGVTNHGVAVEVMQTKNAPNTAGIPTTITELYDSVIVARESFEACLNYGGQAMQNPHDVQKP